MRLLCLHADTIRALASLHAPFDDLTPEGLWGTDYHLVGVTADQRDVLRNFGIDLEDVTPAQLETGRPEGMRAPSGPRTTPPAPRLGARPEPAVSREPMRPREVAPPVSREPAGNAGRMPEPRDAGVADRSITQSSSSAGTQSSASSAPQASAPATQQPSASGNAAKGDVTIARSVDRGAGGVATRAPMKLRTRFKGKYKEATVQDGKIVLDGNKFDSPMHASKSLAPDKKDWELWEYYDDEAGKWYMLDREWETA